MGFWFDPEQKPAKECSKGDVRKAEKNCPSNPRLSRDNMLKKKNRVNKKEVDLIFKQGRFLNSPSLTFKFIIINENRRKISFIAPKSIAKLAVKRNFLRRKGYNVLQKYINGFPAGILGVFVFKKYQDDVLILENEIKNILAKIN